MGVHDYSCFICSDEGEQSLTNWTKYNTRFASEDRVVRNTPSDSLSDLSDDSDSLSNYDNLLCTFPANPGECSQAGQNSCYLYHFKNDPLVNKEPPLKIEKAKYSWDDWCFEKYPSYSEILSSYDEPNGSKLCSVWRDDSNPDYIVNVCPDCHKYFISDELDNPPPLLLTTFLCKFNLAPFQPFNTVTTINTTYADPPIEHLFPLTCTELRDYVRAFCYHFKLRETPIDFQFRFDDNPLVAKLELSSNINCHQKVDSNDPDLMIDYDAMDLNRPGIASDGKLYTPMLIAIKNRNIAQIEALISRGVKFPVDSYHLLLDDPNFRHIIWDNIQVFDRETIARIVLMDETLWSSVPKSFFNHKDIKTAVDLYNNKINDGRLLKYLITLFPDEYQKTKYYDKVCNRDIVTLTKLFELGFSPQTHFDHVVNLNWVEGTILCLKYGAVLDGSAKYHLDRHNKPQMKALFQ